MLNTGKKSWLGRSLLALVLAVALVLPMVPVSFAEATALDVSIYKQGEDPAAWTYPEEEGKVFAGWYTDTTYTTPYADLTGTAYPKFVDAELITVKRQFNVAASQKSSTVNVRFITGLDSLNYHNVIFNVEIPSQDKSWTWTEKTAYSSLEADGKTQAAADVFTSAEYLVVHSLNNVPNAVFAENFEVTISWTTLDGTVVNGETAVFTLNSLLAESVQISLENFDSNTVGNSVGKLATTSSHAAVTATVAAGGIGGSNAVAYTISTVNKTNSRNVTLTFDSIDVASNDVVWFWVDSDMDADRLLHVQLNSSHLASNFIYTIVDKNGAPSIEKVSFSVGTTEGDGLALVDSSGAGGDTAAYARVRLDTGWYGWIGVPVGNFNGNNTTAPSAITSLTFRTFCTADNSTAQTVYFDEFWLTSEGEMPNLTNAQLLYNGDPAESTDTDDYLDIDPEAKQIQLLNFNDYTAGTTVGSITQKSSYSQVTCTASANGINGSVAASYVIEKMDKSNSENLGITFDSQAADATDIIWFWVDSDMDSDRLLHIQLESSHLATNYIYTIADVSGTPTILQVDYNAEGVTEGDGLALVASGGNGGEASSSAYARVRLDAGWYGWIGIPVGNFCGNSTTAPTTASKLTFRVFGNYNSETLQTIYFDEVWLTGAGVMPGLKTSALLYNGDAS